MYEGSVAKRDGAYHQGTVWPWLTGAYVEATLKVTGKLDRAREALDALLEGLFEAGIGTLSEIYDGDPPHRPRGCIAQAWSVAEAVRALDLLNRVRGESSPAEPSVRREEVTPDGAPANGPGGDGS